MMAQLTWNALLRIYSKLSLQIRTIKQDVLGRAHYKISGVTSVVPANEQ